MSSYQFGPFELDAEGCELRKHGTRIRLQKQPFQVLLTLVERSGTVVSREDLRQTVWADGTFVDFDHGLNAAVNKVRQALGDSSDRAHYVETIPGQGYRFVAPAEKHPGPQPKYPEQPGETVAVQTTAITGLAKRWNVRVAAGAAALVLCIIGSYFYFQRTPKLTDKDSVVIADFTNATGDAEFNDMLREALAIQLEESPFLKVLDDDVIYQDLQLMGQPKGARVTNDVAREICQRENKKAMISGAIGSMGKSFSITLQATNCQSGETLARQQIEVPDKEHALDAVVAAAKKMRGKLGESLSSIERLAPLMNEDRATTPSFAAFRTFALGAAQFHQGNYLAAIPVFRQALDLDPNFATAWYFLATAYLVSGDSGEHMTEGLQRAFDLRDRVSERERFFAEGLYYYYSMHDWQRTRESAELWMRAYPRDLVPHNQLGLAWTQEGGFEDALREYQRSNELGGAAVIKSNVANAFVRLDRFADAKTFIRNELARNADNTGLHETALRISFMEADEDSSRRVLEWFSAKTAEYAAIEIQAMNASVLGQRRREAELRRQASELRTRKNLAGDIPAAGATQPEEDALAGACESTRRASGARTVALALCGDTTQTAQALRTAEEAARSRPYDMPITAVNLPLARAAASLSQGRPAAALEQLQLNRPHRAQAPGGDLFAGPGLSAVAQRRGGRHRISEDRRSQRRFLGPVLSGFVCRGGARRCARGRHAAKQESLRGLSRPLERCRR